MQLLIAFLIGAMYVIVGFVVALLLKASIDEAKQLNIPLIKSPLFCIGITGALILVVLVVKLIHASFVYFPAG